MITSSPIKAQATRRGGATTHFLTGPDRYGLDSCRPVIGEVYETEASVCVFDGYQNDKLPVTLILRMGSFHMQTGISVEQALAIANALTLAATHAEAAALGEAAL